MKLNCPECGSTNVWQDSLQDEYGYAFQKCRDCGATFVGPIDDSEEVDDECQQVDNG